MRVDVLDGRTMRSLATLSTLTENSTISDVKKCFTQAYPSVYPERQAYKQDKKGKTIKDSEKLSTLPMTNDVVTLYYKDLGPQIGWTTVFLTEYAGPLFVYLLVWFIRKPKLVHSQEQTTLRTLALICWIFHYAKRLLETLFVHRFSHATMPIMNLFKNCTYYWGFAAFVSYFINHPLYTVPSKLQMYSGLLIFSMAEFGNFSCHMALRNLRPAGTNVRRIPNTDKQWPLSSLFEYVACPNYTYEVTAWIGFSLMTQSFPALLFTIAGFYQMSIWAKGKLRNYRKEFSNFPAERKAIIPYIL